MIALLVAATGSLMLATANASGADWRLIILSSFRLYLIAIAVALAVLVLVVDPDFVVRAGLLVLLLMVIAANLLPVLQGIRQSREAIEGQRLRIVFANLLESNLAHQRVIDWVREEKPDIFIAAEVASAWRISLAALNEQFPFSTPSRNGDVVLFSRLPFESEPVDFYPDIGHAVTVDIAGVSVFAIHAASPQTARFVRAYASLLDTVAARVRASDRPTVAIGDFNAAPWTNAVRKFQQATGLRCGPGAWIGSYPAELGGRKFPTWLALPIDIAMAGHGARVVSRRHGPLIGSDHWPIQVEVATAKRSEKPANPAP